MPPPDRLRRIEEAELIGRAFGPYRIVSLIGAGGMGEVYLARDTTLGRDVAIKVLPSSFSSDPARRSRFEREARLLASFTHPNIATIHGLIDIGDRQGLVLEYLPGQTLADRLRAGPLDHASALAIARQIAEALDVAHERGIIHRDLKPANVQVLPDGRVKVLDFGLARHRDRSPAESDTGSTGNDRTTPGLILGTPRYMSPEQARGGSVDKRTDIWAFGCVLYEMLAGRPAFPGSGAAETIAAVLDRDPVIDLVPSPPAGLRPLVARCLEKDPARRIRDMGDVRYELDALGREPQAPGGPSTHRSRPGALVAIGLAAGIALATFTPWRTAGDDVSSAPTDTAVTLEVDLGPDVVLGESLGPDVVMSPDGERIAFVSRNRLSVRVLRRQVPVELPGTEGASAPFFSPDGRWVAFFADGLLKRVPVDGGDVATIADAPDARGGSWSDDDRIVVGGALTGLQVVSAAGGVLEPLSPLESGEVTHRWPTVLPGGGAVLFTSHRFPLNFEDASIDLLRLTDGVRTRLVTHAHGPLYLAGQPGYLIYSRDGNVLAQRLDPERGTLDGLALTLFESVVSDGTTGFSRISVSRSGRMVYRPDSGRKTLIEWLEPEGVGTPVGEPGDYTDLALSHDGSRFAYSSRGRALIQDWRRSAILPLHPSARAYGFTWTPDDRYLAASTNDGIFVVRSDGASEPAPLVRSPNYLSPSSFSPDGRWLLYQELKLADGRSWDVLAVPIARGAARLEAGDPIAVAASAADERSATFSPDGRWVAYQSAESGRFEVYVRAFPPDDHRWQVSFGGGLSPQWGGGRLFFLDGRTRRVMAAPFEVSDGAFSPAPAVEWSPRETVTNLRSFAVSPRGDRVAALVVPGDMARHRDESHVMLVLNPVDVLAQRAPAGARP